MNDDFQLHGVYQLQGVCVCVCVFVCVCVCVGGGGKGRFKTEIIVPKGVWNKNMIQIQ